MCVDLDALCERLAAEAAPELAAAKTEPEARVIVERIVAQVVARLDAHEVAILGDLLTGNSEIVKH